MAFKPESLSALSYGNGFTLWHYRTTDVANEVDTSGYFNRAAAMLRVGDFLMVNVAVGTTNGHGLMVVTVSANGVVDVANMTALATVNSD